MRLPRFEIDGFLLVLGLTAIAVVAVFASLHHHDTPTPNELCADHGGVANVGGGGWATPLVATCKDGLAGKVRP